MKPERFDYDLFLIGAGSGGVRAARMAAQHGVRVAVAEAAALGGTCVNAGCIPKKLLSYAAGYAEAFHESAGYGWHGQAPVLDWEALKAARAAELARLNGVYARLLASSGVQVIAGRGRLEGPHTVVVGGNRYTARHIVVATGGVPYVPDLPGRELAVTSDRMFDLPRIPRRLAVVGAGYIACEFASIFRGLGVEVTLVHRGNHLLDGFDADVRRFLAEEMGRKGIDIKLNWTVESLARGDDGGLTLTSGMGATCDADVVLFATGRVPNTANLGLESAGVQLDDKGAIVVDENYRTNLTSVHAIGDVSSRKQLTPVALAEAMALVECLFGAGRLSVDYDFIPTAVFTHPNVGTVGQTEAEARAASGQDGVIVYRSDFRALRHTLSGSGERTLVKLVVDKATDRVIGLHMVGPDAGEVIQGFAVALRAGATKALFDSTIGVHPTVAEEFVTLRQPATDH
ncbi:glutathione-disulfide reductase [Bordetella flabilis]|uniref:Glutathione-disulfide reductase n=1 Tax=Bordetella flabilis TaxID=463014 RepID=A0A193GDF3_9BORD|nr:glutathione-disulfide reductase [Bordetella flabilis]ANN77845.1 glutathione-disulfide reductase [Bordetella flabilis]